MDDLEQTPPKFEDMQPHGGSEPWHCGRAEDYLYYFLVSFRLEVRDYCNTTGVQRLIRLKL